MRSGINATRKIRAAAGFNANVTITPQDSTGINNPDLIDNLVPGLYSIQKNYDGIIEETVIFKENNN